MNNFQIVTALHGNEYTPVLAMAVAGIPQVIGNPQALALNQRYVDADLNGVFGFSGQGYEYKRSQELLDILDKNIPVIDFHTFSAASEPFVIFVEQKMLPLAKKTGIKKLIYMKYNFKKGQSLIDHIPGVSVEVGTHGSKESFEMTTMIAKNVLFDLKTNVEPEVYEVFDIITEAGDYKNFELYQGDFYPVLSGKNPYDFYGLKARRVC